MARSRKTFENGIKSLQETIDDRIQEFLEEDLLIAIPAVVVGVGDYTTLQCVDVQPVFTKKLKDGREIKAPVIQKVFVKNIKAGYFSITFPIAVGDLVTLHYSHVEISRWLDTDGGTLVQDTFSTPSERDCWVEHGFGTRENNQSPNQRNLEIISLNTDVIPATFTALTLDPSGTVSIASTNVVNVQATEVNVTASGTDNKVSVTSNDISLNGNTTVTGSLEVSNGLEVTGGGADITGAVDIDGGLDTTGIIKSDADVIGTIGTGTVSLTTHLTPTAPTGPTSVPTPVPIPP